jgi:ankyrin repeat protein
LREFLFLCHGVSQVSPKEISPKEISPKEISPKEMTFSDNPSFKDDCWKKVADEFGYEDKDQDPQLARYPSGVLDAVVLLEPPRTNLLGHCLSSSSRGEPPSFFSLKRWLWWKSGKEAEEKYASIWKRAVFCALEADHLFYLKFLFENAQKGCKVNDNFIDFAAISGSTRGLELLIEKFPHLCNFAKTREATKHLVTVFSITKRNIPVFYFLKFLVEKLQWKTFYVTDFMERPNIKYVKLLLEHGADPEKGDDHQCNGLPLLYATATGNFEMVKILIQYGADPQRPGLCFGKSFDWTFPMGFPVYPKTESPIQMCLRYRNLLNRDAILSVLTKKGFTVPKTILFCLVTKDLESFKTVFSTYGKPLHLINILHSSPEIVQYVLEQEPKDVNDPGESYQINPECFGLAHDLSTRSLSVVCIYHPQIPILKILLDAGAEVQMRDFKSAIFYENYEIAQVLIQRNLITSKHLEIILQNSRDLKNCTLHFLFAWMWFENPFTFESRWGDLRHVLKNPLRNFFHFYLKDLAFKIPLTLLTHSSSFGLCILRKLAVAKIK